MDFLIPSGKMTRLFISLMHNVGLIQNGKTITEDMANKTLKHLLKFDFIKKIKSPTSHEQKDFTLTPYGREALVLIHKLMDFGSRYNNRMDIKNAEE